MPQQIPNQTTQELFRRRALGADALTARWLRRHRLRPLCSGGSSLGVGQRVCVLGFAASASEILPISVWYGINLS